jgi:AcrR family transcriptional regulator
MPSASRPQSQDPARTAHLTRGERRRLIERAATRLFAQRGYASTTVDDVAQAAGVTKPIVYRHFESKQELCIALLERSRDELIAAPLARFTPGVDAARAQIPAMLEAWVEHVGRHRDAARLLFTPISGDPEVERAQRNLHARQRATLTALLRELAPALADAEAEPLGELLRAALAGVALWWLDHPDAPRELPTRALLRLVEGVLGTLQAPEAHAERD